MKKKLTILLVASGLLITFQADAAFPVVSKTTEQSTTSKKTRTKKSNRTSKINYVPIQNEGLSSIGTERFTNETNVIENKSTSSENKMSVGDNQLVALLLAIFLGGLGVHRFYLGYYWQGVVQILTGGGLGVWWLIDIIRIATGSLQPKGGSYSTTL